MVSPSNDTYYSITSTGKLSSVVLCMHASMNGSPETDGPTPVEHLQPGIPSGHGGSLLAYVACAFRPPEELMCFVLQSTLQRSDFIPKRA